MEQARWNEAVLSRLEALSEEGRDAAAYLHSRGKKIRFWKVRRNVGALWTVFGNIYMNAALYTPKNVPGNLYAETLLIHEVWHLKQGVLLALSVYGELEAWQLQFRLFHRISGTTPPPAIAELLKLPLTWDRAVLHRARELMRSYAGKGYRADLLPLYPLGREAAHWMRKLSGGKSAQTQASADRARGGIDAKSQRAKES